MFRLIRRLVILVTAGILLFVLVPPGPRTLPAFAPASADQPAGTGPGVRGVMHIHTLRSDGTGSIDDVTAAAARAGLAFVIVTDHGDATREPDLPDYRNGVLYIDAVEISTNDGHVVALGLPKAPYPLRGDGRDVLEDIARLGGFAIAAHPGSPKPELRWTEWNAPLGGLEWVNGDSEWRDEPPWTLLRALITYPFRPPQALALLLDRPEPVMQRWDALTQQRRIVAVAGSDAHARIGPRGAGEPYDGGGSIHFPSYRSVFGMFSVTLPDLRLSGDAAADARAVLAAIRAGHVYSTIDALAGPASLRFTAASGGRRATMGEPLPLDGPVKLRVDAQAPADAQITLLRNGVAVDMSHGAALDYDAPAESAVYRVEVALPGSPGTPPVPWLVSNPIYVGRTADAPVPPPAPPRQAVVVYDNGPARGWVIEKSAASDAAIDVVGTLGGSQLLLRFALSGTPADNPYAAFAMPATPAIAMHRSLVLTARAIRPMRMTVQLRAPSESAEGAGERWQRSVYLDQSPRTIQLPFDDFRPLGPTSAATPALSRIQSILFVVDTVNAKIGSNGEFTVDDIKYAD